MKKGNNILIYEGATAIAGTRDFTLNETMDVQEKSSPSSSQARTYDKGLTGWDVTVTRLITAMKGTVLHEGSTYSMAIRVRDDAGDYVTGTALCVQAQVDAAVDSLARGTWRFIGIDALTSASTGDFNNDFSIDFLIS